MYCKSLFNHGESPAKLKVKNSLTRFHVLRRLSLLASELSENWRFFACFIALFASFLAHLNCSDMSSSFEEIAFLLINLLLRILCNNLLVIHGARFLLILFLDCVVRVYPCSQQHLFPFLPHVIWIRTQINIRPWHLFKIT